MAEPATIESAAVTLSAAKNLCAADAILRVDQDDKLAATRLAIKAFADRDTGLRPSTPEMQVAASITPSSEMPVSMPSPCSRNSTLPVAPFAYGQPPRPATLASKFARSA